MLMSPALSTVRPRHHVQQAVMERQQRGRRVGAQLIAQEHPCVIEGTQRLRHVALPCLCLHQQGIAGLSERLARD
jgi:hypothetical protein